MLSRTDPDKAGRIGAGVSQRRDAEADVPPSSAYVIDHQNPALDACHDARFAEMPALLGMGRSANEARLKRGDKSGVKLGRHGLGEPVGQAVGTA